MVTDWPQRATHELRRTLYQSRRVYSGDLTDPVVFGDRPLWNATLDWGYQPTAKAEKIVAQIGEVAEGESNWLLFKSGEYKGKAMVDSTWATLVSSYDADAGTITLKAAPVYVPGELLQVGRYVLRITKKVGAVVTVENFPEAIDSMNAATRNALVFGYSRPNANMGLSIKARVLDARSPSLEKVDAEVSIVRPITIVEVA